jgi:hypothetical protein
VQVRVFIEAPVIGLEPTSPDIADVPGLASVIPEYDRIVKGWAELRFTSNSAPITPGIITAVIRQMTAMVIIREKLVLAFFCVFFMFHSS